MQGYKRSRAPGYIFCLLTFFLINPASAQNFSELDNTTPAKGQPSANSPSAQTDDIDEVQKAIELAKTLKLTPPQDETYILDKTDVLEISIMRHPEVSGKYVINNEGKVQYEFVGDIPVGGKTKSEVAAIIAGKLKDYIINPEVTVKISEYNSKVVYVVGEVVQPGRIFMRGNTITIREALLDAGLPMLSGVTKRSRLITPSEKGKGSRKMVNVYALLYEGDLRENFVMKPGDILYIPPTFLTKTMRAITPVTAPVSDVSGTSRGAFGIP